MGEHQPTDTINSSTPWSYFVFFVSNVVNILKRVLQGFCVPSPESRVCITAPTRRQCVMGWDE